MDIREFNKKLNEGYQLTETFIPKSKIRDFISNGISDYIGDLVKSKKSKAKVKSYAMGKLKKKWDKENPGYDKEYDWGFMVTQTLNKFF